MSRTWRRTRLMASSTRTRKGSGWARGDSATRSAGEPGVDGDRKERGLEGEPQGQLGRDRQGRAGGDDPLDDPEEDEPGQAAEEEKQRIPAPPAHPPPPRPATPPHPPLPPPPPPPPP